MCLISRAVDHDYLIGRAGKNVAKEFMKNHLIRQLHLNYNNALKCSITLVMTSNKIYKGVGEDENNRRDVP